MRGGHAPWKVVCTTRGEFGWKAICAEGSFVPSEAIMFVVEGELVCWEMRVYAMEGSFVTVRGGYDCRERQICLLWKVLYAVED